MPTKQVNGSQPRVLPQRMNPLLALNKTPEHAELTKRRRLGRTELVVPAGLVGTDSATKPENLGLFDYVHIRAPLPNDLTGSGVFALKEHQSPPTQYFIMRRSSDGFVSATQLFKAAFPWAKVAEEASERDYIKSLESTAIDEVAGNVWVSAHTAIELADEYGIVAWVHALLDPAPVAQTTEDSKGASISPPPKFKFTAGDKAHLPPPNGTPRVYTPKPRGRPRGASPSKNASSSKSTKKPRAKKAEKEANAPATREASASLHATVDSAASVAESESVEPEGDNVAVTVESHTETKGDTETTTTNVKIDMPGGSAEMALPESPEEMIEKAKEMVEEARKLDGEHQASGSKRRAEELDDDDEDEANDEELPPAKRVRVLKQTLKTENVRNRALIGVAATFAIGICIPVMFGS